MSRDVPESREVWEHREREFVRADGRPNKALVFLSGMIAGMALLIAVTFVVTAMIS